MLLALAVAGLIEAPVLACPICFQVEAGATTDGVRAAVTVLVAVTVGVLTGFLWFIGRFVRRTAGAGHAGPAAHPAPPHAPVPARTEDTLERRIAS